MASLSLNTHERATDDGARILVLQALLQMACRRAAACEAERDTENGRRYEALAAEIRQELVARGYTEGGTC
jgi:hypothetical protein